MSLISWRQHLHWVLFIGTKTTIRYTFCILFLLEAKIPSICPQGLILYAPNALHSNYLNSGAIKWSNQSTLLWLWQRTGRGSKTLKQIRYLTYLYFYSKKKKSNLVKMLPLYIKYYRSSKFPQKCGWFFERITS